MKMIFKYGQKIIELSESFTIKFTSNNEMLTIHHRNGNQFPIYFNSVEISYESVIINVMLETDMTLLQIFISKNQ